MAVAARVLDLVALGCLGLAGGAPGLAGLPGVDRCAHHRVLLSGSPQCVMPAGRPVGRDHDTRAGRLIRHRAPPSFPTPSPTAPGPPAGRSPAVAPGSRPSPVAAPTAPPLGPSRASCWPWSSS